MIKKILAGAFVLAAASAQAETFQYSFVQMSGFSTSVVDTTVTGYFNGSLSGGLITDLTNISASYNGVAFNGSGNLNAWHYEPSVGWVSGGAVVEFGSQPQSYFGSKTSFRFTGLNSGSAFGGTKTENDPFVVHGYSAELGKGFHNFMEGYPIAIWTVTMVSAVPEPETYALMLAGLGVMGAVVRRRKASQV